MTTYIKNYIGKGTQVNGLDIIKVVIPVEEAMKATFEKNGVTYISFEIAKMKEPDKFDRTHTCYYQTKADDNNLAEDMDPKNTKKVPDRRSKKDLVDLPF